VTSFKYDFYEKLFEIAFFLEIFSKFQYPKKL